MKFSNLKPVALAAFLALAHGSAAAQAYPSKPIRMITPYGAGGAADIIARTAAAELGNTLGQPVVVENRPGAGGTIGFEAVATSTPDGYTLIMTSSSLHGMSAALYTNLKHDPNKDLAPIVVLAQYVNVLVVNPDMKATTVRDVIALAKAQPGRLTFASGGVGTSVYMSGEMFKLLTGVELTHIGYKGSVPALTDLIAGRVDMMFDNIPSALPHIKNGRLRAIASTGPRRAAALPEVPTIAESGVPGYAAVIWSGLMAPSGTPVAIINKLNAEANKAARSPVFIKRMADIGNEIVGGTPETMAEMIREEQKTWFPVVKASGAKPE